MKNLNLKAILLFVSVVILSSCSSDDNDEPKIIIADYFPSTATSYWNYDVTEKDNDAKTTISSKDFLTVKSSTPFKLEANAGNGANGFMNALLVNGTLTSTESTLLLSGSLEVPIDGIDDLNIDFSNAKLYDLNANNNEVLTSFDGTFTKDLDGLPLTLTYSLNFNKVKDLNSYITHKKVSLSNISLNLSISTVVDVNGVVKTLMILDEQEILSINSYFSENVGLIKSESKIDYELKSSTITSLKDFGIDLALESKSSTNTQVLTNSFIAE